ncbi:MAG TPA: HlyD family efflux transporter periplasmic adaptor subunit [Devosia sp.]|nr:HlyD family efflux transporter periplasmic adaptor subunit [Devosia sp.]
MSGLLAWLMGVLAFLPGVGHAGPPTWYGYVEDDYAYVSPTSAGAIISIPVAEGQAVHKGDVLFVLDHRQQQASLEAAAAQADAARANLANLQTGERPEEVKVTQSQLQKAQSDLALAQQTLSRTLDLFHKGNVPQSEVDTATSGVQSAQSAVATLEAQIAVANLPARAAQQQAAEAQLAAAEAQAKQAEAALDDRTVKAPEDGTVERLFFKPGEVAAAATPVLALRGAAAMKVLFYLDEADRQEFAIGQRIAVSCDGCAADLTATISHFDSDPQYTPPVIYSRDERSRLVFRTEAILARQGSILPGQPVSVERLP